MERGNLCQCITKKRQIPKISSCSDAAEFVNKVQDQVRNRQKRLSNIAESSDEHSIIWEMFKRRISLDEQKAQKEDRFLRGRQIAYLIYDQFRVTGTDSSVENYTDLFTIALRNDDIQEFDSKWDGILLSLTKIPSDDILEGLYK